MQLNLKCTAAAALADNVPFVQEDRSYAERVLQHEISPELFDHIQRVKPVAFGVTANFKKVIDDFKVAPGETPAGYRVEYSLDAGRALRADLKRDISYDKNEVKRPTRVLFSADSANPYEVAHVKDMISNLTCNPAIIYNMFLNDPKANVGGKFKDRDEVMRAIAETLGPGCDISVELNDPFGSSESELLEEAARFKEILSEHRVIIKVPHTGAVNARNVKELMAGDKLFQRRYNQGSVEDYYRGHNLALMLHEHGYRVNFTLMFEPYQTQMALQARPAFINSFVMFRQTQSRQMANFVTAYEATSDQLFLEQLRDYMVKQDYLSAREAACDLHFAYARAKDTLRYRGYDHPGADGLDGIRHNLRLLRDANLPDTRLIICNFQSEYVWPEVDRMLMEPEFRDVTDRVVVTAPPALLGEYTTNALVTQFHRRFMNAANGAK
jgi:hypothetical protein